MSEVGEVKVWYMTEEERLAYIKKHPIKSTKKPKGASYVNVDWELTRRKDKRK
jgi:hypothetical protein